MIASLIGLFIRLCLGAIALALRLTFALAALMTRLLAFVIGSLWQSWRRARLQAKPFVANDHACSSRPDHHEVGRGPAQPPQTPSFTPRPLRRRPGR